MEKLKSTLEKIAPPDRELEKEAQNYLDSLTKPVGSLGILEEIARKIAGITGELKPKCPQKACILMAGDHGVVAEGVSSYPRKLHRRWYLIFFPAGQP